jgi:hypothetical protein
VHLANISTMLPTGELAPYLIVGLHSEVHDCSFRICYPNSSCVYVWTQVISFKGALMGSSSSENMTPDDRGTSHGGGGSSDGMRGTTQSSSSNTAGLPGSAGSGGSADGRAADHDAHVTRLLFTGESAAEDDEHTIIHDILTAHQDGLSRAASRAEQQVEAPCFLAPAPTLAPTARFPVPATPPRAHVDVLRTGSAMSVLTCNTDGETASSPTSANLLVRGFQAMSSFSPVDTAKFHSLAPTGTGLLPVEADLRTPPHNGARTASDSYPAIQGLPSSALHSMSAFQSPTSTTIPPYPHSRSPAGTPCQSPPTATALRRSYFAALDATSTGSPSACAAPAAPAPPLSPPRFTPSAGNNSAFSPLRRAGAMDMPTTPVGAVIETGASSKRAQARTATASPRGPQKKVSFDEYAADVARAPQSPVSCFELGYAHKPATPGPSTADATARAPGQARVFQFPITCSVH